MEDDLILVQASSRQARIALEQRYDPSGPISKEQHVSRAGVLGAYNYANERQIYWVLVPRDDVKTDYTRSHVATIIRTVLLQGEEGSSDSKPLRSTSFSITHVFTPPELRRRGHATRMMSLLHRKLRDGLEQQDKEWPSYPTGILSFLYSGVGDFYSKCGNPGWHITTSTETYWKVEDILASSQDTTNLTSLSEDDFVKVAEADAAAMEAELAQRVTDRKPRAFAVLPTGEEFAWLVGRSKFYGQILSPEPLPTTWGVKDAGDDPDYAVWFFDYPKHELHFLRLRSRTKETFTKIIYAAGLAAESQGCRRLLAWNVDEKVLNDCPDPQRITQPRTKNLAAVAWYGPDRCPEWIHSQKYGWC